MPNPAELHPDSIELPSPELHEAEVLDTADTVEDLVRCVIPDFDPRFATDPAQWTPYPKPAGLFYPKKGDRAIVSYHDDGPAAIIAWWPSASEPDHPF